MLKLIAVMYIVIAPTLAGIFLVVVVSVESLYTDGNVLISVIVGAVVALPVSWLVARAVLGNKAGAT